MLQLRHSPRDTRENRAKQKDAGGAAPDGVVRANRAGQTDERQPGAGL